jgi:nucleoid-associated protein YgaU
VEDEIAEPTVTAPAEVATDSESAAAAQTLPAQPSAQMYQLGPDGQRLKERVQPGDRLTLMARRLYGHKAFWVYIYEVNKDRLKSPNNVAVGMDLYLPDPAYWQIDADNEASVQTALRRASKLVD